MGKQRSERSGLSHEIPTGREPALIYAAKLVAKVDLEPWLLENWREASRALGYQHAQEPDVPLRAQLHQRLKSVLKAANTLHRELHGSTDLPDPHLFGILERIASDLDLSSLYRNLDLLQTRCIEEIEASDRRGGSHRIQPNPSGLTGPAQCALLILGAWTACRGTNPASSDRNATCAAEALWRASGGLPRQGVTKAGNDPDHHARWQVPFEDAAACDPWIKEKWRLFFLHQPRKERSIP